MYDLMVLAVRQIIHLRLVELMNDDLERIWKEAGPVCLTYYEVSVLLLGSYSNIRSKCRYEKLKSVKFK
jgi:hypothetical protein